ncbi:MAG: hypothetical protein WAU31_04810, partial [Candidatus Moraniibacteriota bacterium]
MNRLAVLFTILTAFFIGHTASAVAQEATLVAPEAPVYTNCKAVTDGLSDRCVGEISPEIGGHIVHYNSLDEVLANGVIPPTDRDIKKECVPREVFFFSSWTGWN